MLRTIRKPFGYEPIIKKEDIKGSGKKKKGSVRAIGNRYSTEFGNLSMNSVACSLQFSLSFLSVRSWHCLAQS